MTNRIYIIALLIGAACPLLGQNGIPVDPYLDLIEVSTNSKFNDTIHTTQGIVDFESELLIRLRRDEIVTQMLVAQGVSRNDSRLASLYRINGLLDMQVDVMKKVNELVALDQAGQKKPFALIQEFAEKENEILAIIQADSALFAKAEEGILTYLDRQTADPSYTYIQYIFSILDEEAERLENSFLTEIESETNGDSAKTVYFRLGAFVQNKQGGYPIHVENFDTYSSQSYSQELSTSQSLSQEEKQALETNLQLGKELKTELNLGNLRLQKLFESEEELFESKPAYDTLKTVFIESQDQLKGIETVDSIETRLISTVNTDLQQIDVAFQVLTSTIESFSGSIPSGTNRIDKLQSSLNEFEQLVSTAYERFDTGLAQLREKQNVSIPNVRMEIFSKLDNSYSGYQTALKKDVSGLTGFLQKTANVLNPLKKNSLENDQFSEKVSRFTFNNLPAEGIITLKTTGARPGEDIIIKAVLQRGRSPQDRYFEEIILSRRVVRLERVSAHLKMGGSLILATPYNPTMTSDTVSLGGSFQFAPSYTIFMSWGSRRSRFYNNYLGFGLGLGFSSPDFNLDGTPEFGVSAMATALQDIVSVGWGWNFGVDTPFWYVGFNIPFTIGGIPNLGSTQAVSR